MVETEAHRRISIGGAREDINDFCEALLKDQVTGDPIRQGTIHREGHAHFDENPWAGYVGPREHGKTEQFIVARCLFDLGHNTNLRNIVVSSVDLLAQGRVMEMREHIEKSQVIKEAFPNLKPDYHNWGKTQFTVQRKIVSADPSVQGCGVFSTGTGGRTDRLYCDDVADYRNSVMQKTQRTQVLKTLQDVWFNRVTDNGRVVYVANIWHRADATSRLMEMSAWKTRFKITRIPRDMTPIWPEKWPRERLKERRENIGERAFALGFFLVPMADEELLFPSIIIGESIDQPGKIRNYHLSVSEVLAMRLPMFPIFMASDLAISQEDSADYTVHFAGAYDSSRNITYAPIDIAWGKFNPTEAGKMGLALYGKYLPNSWLVETNGYQKAFLTILQLLPNAPKNIPLRSFTTGRNKNSQDVGLSAMSTRMSTGGWVVPMKGHGPDDHGHDETTCPTCRWLGELSEQTLSGHIGTHDDLLMASWLFSEAIRLGGGRGTAMPQASSVTRQDRIAPGVGIGADRFANLTRRDL